MRSVYYAHTRSTGQSVPRTRKRQTTTEDAIDAIGAEIAAGKTRAEEAKAEYEHLRDTAEERKAAIQAKIDALIA